ncbi:MAG TPA: hypothetical protein VKU82_12205 [Planctomycetaceae bacterium]|nr:hypothetical protein [Planctomycetaceae bacterium]
MTSTSPETSVRASPWFVLFIAAAVAAVTQVPFLLGERWAADGAVFDGLVGMIDDQNMAFSFIRQAAEGHWLFVNRLTYIDHEPVLFNLEWLAVGQLMSWLGGSEAGAYAAWRWMGISLVIGGFWCLAGACGLKNFERKMALWMCALGGGFGWLFLILERGGLIARFSPATLDLSHAVHPFSHMFANPHLSVSHGLSLLFLAAFATGEQTAKAIWYVIAGVIGVIHGLVRPYDLILISGVIPAFILIERIAVGKWSLRKTALRLLPLAAIAPVLGYYVALFRFHPVFKYWASQGEVEPIGIHWQLLSFGLAGVLCLVRLGLARRYPLKSPERLLVVWIVVVLLLIHGKQLPGLGFMPFAPVFGVTLVSTMLVLGAAALSPFKVSAGGGRGWRRPMLIAALIGVNSIGSAVWLVKITRNLAYFPDHYIGKAEHEAHLWLSGHAGESDVVLSTLTSGNRMAKYVSCRFALAHWSVTPHVNELSSRVDRFYRAAMTDDEALELLRELHVRWIYAGPREEALGKFEPAELPGVAERFANRGVRIYFVEPQKMAE